MKFWAVIVGCACAAALMLGYSVPYIEAPRAVETAQAIELECEDRAVPQSVINAAEEAKAEEEARKKSEEEARLKAEEEARIKAEEEARAAEEAALAEQVVYYEEPVYYEPTYTPSYTAENTPNIEDVDFKSAGVVYQDGVRYTYYSERVLPGGGLTELNNNGRTVNEQGFVTDGDGYLAVASNDYPKGTKLDTPWGAAVVYDSGCDSGTVDMYVSW